MKRIAKVSTAALFLCVGILAGCGGGSDLSTPKGAAKSFAVALEKGDAETAKKASTGADPKTIETLASMASSMKKLQDAAVAKFGEEGKSFGKHGGGQANLSKDLDDAEVKETGDTATITPKDGKPLTLKKINGEWKVDVSEMAGPMASAGPQMFEGMSKSASETADEISAGKYKTAQEAQQALSAKMMSGMMGGLTPPKP